jgi:hypothetical protein
MIGAYMPIRQTMQTENADSYPFDSIELKWPFWQYLLDFSTKAICVKHLISVPRVSSELRSSTSPKSRKSRAGVHAAGAIFRWLSAGRLSPFGPLGLAKAPCRLK